VTRLRRLVAAALLGLACAATVLAAAPDPSRCLATESEVSSGREVSQCLYESAQAGAPAGEVADLLRERGSRRPADGWPLFFLGLLRWNETEEAQELLATATRRFDAAEESRGRVLARGNRLQLLYDLGRLDEAGGEAEAAARLGEASGDPELSLRGRIFLARFLQMSGEDLERSFRLLREIADDLPPDAADFQALSCLSTLGSVAVEIGRLKVAESTYERLLETAGRAENAFFDAEARYGLTRVAAERFSEAPTERGREETVRLAREAVVASDGGEHPTAEALAHWMLGMMGPPDERRFHLERCVERADRSENPRNRAYCLGALARHLARSDPEAAGQVVERVLALAEEAGDPFSSAFAWRERMRIAWAVEPVDEAIAESWEALEAIETLRDLQEGGSEVQAGLFSTWSDDYQWFAGRLLRAAEESGRADLLGEAFIASERLRARALTDWLRLSAERPEAGREPFASLAEVQSALAPNEALLAYQVAPWDDVAGDFAGGAWVIAVTRRSARAHPLEGRRELRFAADIYSGLFAARDDSEADASAELYRRLLAPALGNLPERVDRLILVPDDALHRVPFAALRERSDGPPLIVDREVTIAPSATLWLGWRRSAPPPGTGKRAALVLADPTLPAAAADLVRRGGLAPLPHALLEGRSAVAAFGPTVDLVSGPEATEGYLRAADLPGTGLVVFATHAVTDAESPERSAVVLAAGPGDEDGLLEAPEIVSLGLDGKLVVLSSCRTADGAVLRGEGAMSLARAFFQAGAHTVVASLWPLRDDDAEEVFGRFYRHLARGESVSGALRSAQEELRRSGAPAEAWAGVVVLGAGDLRPSLPPRPGLLRRTATLWIPAAAVGVLVALLVRRALLGRRRSRAGLTA
jgi:CHAT domain-containing protein